MVGVQKLFAPSYVNNQIVVDVLLQEKRPVMFQFVFLDEFLELLHTRLKGKCKRIQFQQFLHHLSPSAKTELIKRLGQLLRNKHLYRQLLRP